MESKKLAGAVSAATLMFSFGALAPASAADGQVFGLQQTVTDPSGEIGYTVTKFLPSGDAVPFPVTGQLYEVTVRADALNGMADPGGPGVQCPFRERTELPGARRRLDTAGSQRCAPAAGRPVDRQGLLRRRGRSADQRRLQRRRRHGDLDRAACCARRGRAPEEEAPPKRRSCGRAAPEEEPHRKSPAPRTPRPTATSQPRRKRSNPPSNSSATARHRRRWRRRYAVIICWRRRGASIMRP